MRPGILITAILAFIAPAAAMAAPASTVALPTQATASSKPAAAPAARCGDPGRATYVAGKTFRGNTVWEDGDTYDMTIVFKADCTLTYGYNGTTYEDALWLQDEDRIMYAVNGGYALYLAHFVSKTSLAGRMINKPGDTGQFVFRLQN
jgi:hypothetical protein